MNMGKGKQEEEAWLWAWMDVKCAPIDDVMFIWFCQYINLM